MAKVLEGVVKWPPDKVLEKTFTGRDGQPFTKRSKCCVLVLTSGEEARIYVDADKPELPAHGLRQGDRVQMLWENDKRTANGALICKFNEVLEYAQGGPPPAPSIDEGFDYPTEAPQFPQARVQVPQQQAQALPRQSSEERLDEAVKFYWQVFDRLCEVAPESISANGAISATNAVFTQLWGAK